MTYRPYPDADRALHQLDRHTATPRPLHFASPATAQLFAGVAAAVQEFGSSLAASLDRMRAASERPASSEETSG
ncbi:hypothetical protein [Streptomyces sp. NPDC002088]|uniref:hypothetical protein n=1 Tax=Streptomyces sp. NPDC002088 TaxID=3154665 RepID=UPI003330B633